MKIKIYNPNGTPLDTYRDRLQDWQQFRQESFPWWQRLPCVDPRYGRIVDLATGEELFIRHSTQRAARLAIVLKNECTGRVFCILSGYDRRSFNKFCYACLEADDQLARMAGLRRPKERKGKKL